MSYFTINTNTISNAPTMPLAMMHQVTMRLSTEGVMSLEGFVLNPPMECFGTVYYVIEFYHI